MEWKLSSVNPDEPQSAAPQLHGTSQSLFLMSDPKPDHSLTVSKNPRDQNQTADGRSQRQTGEHDAAAEQTDVSVGGDQKQSQ